MAVPLRLLPPRPVTDPPRPRPEGAPLRLALALLAERDVAAVRACCPPPVAAEAVGEEAPLSGAFDALLVGWDEAGDGDFQRWALRARTAGLYVFALCGPADRAAALDAGADAAVAHPLDPEVLRAQVRALRRLTTGEDTPTPPDGTPPDGQRAAAQPPEALGPLRLDRRARTATVAGADLPLTLKEFDLLAHLLDHAGACCSRDEILRDVWGIDFETGTNTIDVFVYALRRKLRSRGLSGAIQTVRGVGYRLAPDALTAPPS